MITTPAVYWMESACTSLGELTASLFTPHICWCQVGTLKLTTVEVFTPWELASATNQDFSPVKYHTARYNPQKQKLFGGPSPQNFKSEPNSLRITEFILEKFYRILVDINIKYIILKAFCQILLTIYPNLEGLIFLASVVLLCQ